MSTITQTDEPKLPLPQKIGAMLSYLGLFIYSVITLIEFSKLKNGEKDELDDTCYDIIIFHTIVLGANMFAIMYDSRKCANLVALIQFVIYVFLMNVHFRYKTADVIETYALVITVISLIGFSICGLVILGVCCGGCIFSCQDDEENSEKKHLIQEV